MFGRLCESSRDRKSRGVAATNEIEHLKPAKGFCEKIIICLTTSVFAAFQLSFFFTLYTMAKRARDEDPSQRKKIRTDDDYDSEDDCGETGTTSVSG